MMQPTKADASRVRELLAANKKIINMEGGRKMTALSIAAMKGRSEIVKMLLDAGASAAGVPGRTPPLFLAVAGMPASKAIKGVLRLIADGPIEDASPDDCDLPRIVTPERIAAVSHLLAARADADQREPWAKMTPMVIAALIGSGDIITKLLAAGASVSKEGSGRLSSVRGCRQRSPPRHFAQLVLAVGSKGLALIDDKDDRDYTPLHIAAIRGHSAAVQNVAEARR